MASPSSSATTPIIPSISTISDALSVQIPTAPLTRPAKTRITNLKGLFSSIRDSRKRLGDHSTKSIDPKSLPTPIPTSLPPPVDITAGLIDRGIEFDDARAVSSAYMDKGVKVQILSQQRFSKLQKRIGRRTRHTNVVGNMGLLQEKLRSAQKKLYHSNLTTILSKTMNIVRSTYPERSSARDADCPADGSSDEEEEIADQFPIAGPSRSPIVVDYDVDGSVLDDNMASDDEETEEMSGSANKADQKVLGEMTPVRHCCPCRVAGY